MSFPNMPINIDASKQPQTSYEAGETQGSSAASASKSLPELPKSLPELPSDLASQRSSVLSELASEHGSPTGSSAAPPSAAMRRAQRRMGMAGDSVPEDYRQTLRDAKPSRSDAGAPPFAEGKRADPQVSVGQRRSQNAAASDFLQHDPYGKAGPSGSRLSSTSLKSTRSSSSASSKTSLNSMRSALSNAGSRLQSGVRSALGAKTKSLEDLKKQGEGIRVQQEVHVDNTASEADMNKLAEQNQKIAQGKFGRTM